MMSVPDEWLRAAKAAQKGGIRLAPARRGSEHSILISMPGDWTGATMRGEVRSNPDSPTALATFAFDPPALEGDTTLFTAALSAAATAALPADADFDGVEEFAVDFLIDPAGTDPEELLFAGVLPVMGRITV